jgi:uncharacterized cupredoxin-like copper-binding protein
MTWAIRFVGLAMVAAVLVTAAIVVAAAGGDDEPVTEATIEFRYSKFEQRELTVPAGVPITLHLVNKDPIGHEWIVGDDDVHARHRTGTEPYHDQVPTEVSLRAFETKTTVVTFEEPGDYVYVCHLPGHEEYGMRGTIRVR